MFEIVDDTDFINNGGFSAPQTQTFACPADLGAGNTDVSTSVQATGLTAGTLYDFEVVATNGLGTVCTAAQLQTTPPSVIGDGHARHDRGATLNAQINPSATTRRSSSSTSPTRTSSDGNSSAWNADRAGDPDRHR